MRHPFLFVSYANAKCHVASLLKQEEDYGNDAQSGDNGLSQLDGFPPYCPPDSWRTDVERFFLAFSIASICFGFNIFATPVGVYGEEI